MPHVLVIEDRWLVAQVVADIALCGGARSVAIAGSEDGAVAEARKQAPSIILSRVDLRAGGRGPNAIWRIRREHGPVPAICITSKPDDVQTAEVATVIMVRPVTPNQLLETFRQVVDRLRASGSIH